MKTRIIESLLEKRNYNDRKIDNINKNRHIPNKLPYIGDIVEVVDGEAEYLNLSIIAAAIYNSDKATINGRSIARDASKDLNAKCFSTLKLSHFRFNL